MSHLLVKILQGLANEKIRPSVKFEFQTNNPIFKSISMSPSISMGHTLMMKNYALCN